MRGPFRELWSCVRMTLHCSSSTLNVLFVESGTCEAANCAETSSDLVSCDVSFAAPHRSRRRRRGIREPFCSQSLDFARHFAACQLHHRDWHEEAWWMQADLHVRLDAIIRPHPSRPHRPGYPNQKFALAKSLTRIGLAYVFTCLHDPTPSQDVHRVGVL